MDKDLKIILNRLKAIPFCEGIIFSGSRMESRHSPNSDYDFTVLISKGKSYYKIWRYKNYIIDICCATVDIIEKNDLTNERVSNPELYILSSDHILYDKYGNMKKLQQKAKKIRDRGPKKLNRKNFIEIGYVLKALTDDIESATKSRKQPLFLYIEVLYRIASLFFQLHQAWRPRSRDVEAAMSKIDQSFFELYKKACKKPSAKAALNVVSYLVRKYKLPKTGEIYFLKNK